MIIRDVIHCLESFAPPALQEEYDHSGLQFGSKREKVRGVLLSLDVTGAVVEEAKRKRCNLIIAHHPLLFTKKIRKNSWVDKTIRKAKRYGISVYAIHTNLDNISEGVNQKIAGKLGLKHVKMLLPLPSSRLRGIKLSRGMKTGSGMIGILPKPMTLPAVLRMIKTEMKARMIRHTVPTGRSIRNVAICGGSGSFLLGEAIRQKADLFLTADFRYHQFFDAENKLVIADIGHYETEQFTPELLRDLLKENFSIFAPRFKKGEKSIPLLISEINTNPINYL